jgi:hypothetical protein
MNTLSNRAAASAWARAVAMVQRKQAELQQRQAEFHERAKKAERDLAFSRIWGNSVPRRRPSLGV